MNNNQKELYDAFMNGASNLEAMMDATGKSERGLRISLARHPKLQMDKFNGRICKKLSEDEQSYIDTDIATLNNIGGYLNDEDILKAKEEVNDKYGIETHIDATCDYPEVMKKFANDDEELDYYYNKIKEIEERNKIKIVNLTNHPIVIKTWDKQVTYPPSGTVCRVNIVEFVMDEIDGIPIIYEDVNELINWDPKDKEVYIVSALVGKSLHAKGYTNYVIPFTRKAKKKNGKIEYVDAFYRY